MEHVYEREVDPSANDSLAKIVSRILPGSRVLDVGTGSGALGRFLLSRGCKVDGLTYSEAEALRARSCYERVEVLDLEAVLPSKVLGGARYDFIVCADVLEHLRNAECVLSDLSGLLAESGRVLLSIPNVTHLAVILALTAGRFVRTKEGLLDATHVRFFDRTELDELVRRSGLQVSERLEIRRLLHETEFGRLDFAAVPPAVRSYLATVPDGDIYQFVWVLEPTESPVPIRDSEPVEIPLVDVGPRFGAQLFVDDGGGFSEEASRWAWGRLEEGLQTLRFDGLEFKSGRCLRIDMSDRPGVFEFIHLRLLDASNEVVWQWGGGVLPGVTLNDCECPLVPGAHGGQIFRATTADPFAVIALPALWETVPVRAELVMTAPLQYEDAAFAWAERRYRQQVTMLERELSGERMAMERLQQTLDEVHATSLWKLCVRWLAMKGWLRGLLKR